VNEKKLRKLKVEPFDDTQWDRVEREVFGTLDTDERLVVLARRSHAAISRRPRTPVVMAWTAAAAALVLVIAAAIVLRSPGARVAANPSRISTGANSSHVVLGENAVDVAADSTLVVNGDDAQGMLLVVERGEVTFEIAPRRGRPPVVAVAGAVRVRVVGTHFVVSRVGDSARVHVDHGEVEVSANGATVTLHDGDSWPAPIPSTAPSPVPSNVPSDVVPTPSATQAPSAPSSNARVLRGPPSRGSSDPQVAPTTTSAPPTAPGPSSQELFEQATQLETKDAARAIALYAQVAAGGGPWAMNALFAQGRLEALRGNRAEARRLLEAYVARYPRGPNARDARNLLERLR